MAGTDRDELQRFIAAQRADYLQGLPEKLARMRELWNAGAAAVDPAALAAITRLAHSIHGTAGTYGLADIGRAGGAIEAALDALGEPGGDIAGRMRAVDEAFEAQKGEVETRVQIKRAGKLTTVTYPFNPLDAVGWQGDLCPVRINWRDLRPLMSHRQHLPPSAHTTFLAGRFVVCTFAPRPAESDPDALKLPFFHNNDDYDEVLFYHAGDFFSRDNIKAGMMTFHPSGFTHGPHPKALNKMLVQDKVATDEYAVMIDTRDPLEVGDGASAVENHAYVDSWKAPR